MSKETGSKYRRTIIGLGGSAVKVDVYRVLRAFNTGSPEIDHAIKKLLCAGLRGTKDKIKDWEEAILSISKGIEFETQQQACTRYFNSYSED